MMNTCLGRSMTPCMLLLIWTFLTFQQGYVRGEAAEVRSPTYSPINNGKVAASALAKPLCPNILDIVIAIDSSESVQSVWNKIIDDAEDFIKHFQVADHLTRIGIVDFSAVANVYSPLDSNNTVESANRVFEKLRSRPQNGETWVELGLDRAGEVFDNATPPRLNAKKILIMYTDGESTSRDYNSLKDLVKHHRDQEIETFVVTVTNTSYQPGLQIMATSFAHIYHMGQQTPIGQPSLTEAVCWSQRDTGSPSLNFVDSLQTQNFGPGKTKCQREKEAAELVINSKVPVLVPIFVPECTLDGKYKEIQQHRGTGFYWCVNAETGDIINGTRTVGALPICPHEEESNSTAANSTVLSSGTFTYDSNTKQNLSQAILKNFTQAQKEAEMITKYIPPVSLTRCEEEGEIAKELLDSKNPSSVPIMVPICDDNGFYNPVQGDGNGYMWCVDMRTGDALNATRQFRVQPTCPDYVVNKRPRTICEVEKDENTKKLSAIPDIHIPECSVFDGLYLDVQRIWVGSKFCVKRFTGDHIRGTDTEIGRPDPLCPELTKCERMQVQIHTHHYRNLTRPAILRKDIPQCKRDGFFEEVQSNDYIGQYWCVNKVTGMYIEGTLEYDKKPDCPGASNNEMSSYIAGLVQGSKQQPSFLSSYYNVTKPPPKESSSNNVTKVVNESIVINITRPANGSRIPTYDATLANRPLTHCERQKLDKERHESAISILVCSEHDGLYIEIQQSPSTGRKYCVNRYTGDYIKATLSEPGIYPICPVKSKCEQEREKLHGLNYRNFGKPGYTQRIILTCNKDGFYDLLQTDNRSRVNWCVDELTGEYISPSVMHYPRIPDCRKVSPPHTRCEREKAETGRKQLVVPGTFVPKCNVYNGLYLDVQFMPSTGWKFCVDKFTGERINDTDTPPGPQQPPCPYLFNCQKEQVEAHTYNYRNFSSLHYVERFVPTCEPGGFYTEIQSNETISWCVDLVTGEYISPTIKKLGRLTCPDLNNLRSDVIGDDGIGSSKQQQPISERKNTVEVSPEVIPFVKLRMNETSPSNITMVAGTLFLNTSVTSPTFFLNTSVTSPTNTSVAEPQSNLLLNAPVSSQDPAPLAPAIDTFTNALNASLAIGHAVHFAPSANKTWLLLPSAQQNTSQVVEPIGNDTIAQVIPGVPLKDILRDEDLAPDPVKALFSNQSEALLIAHQNTKVNIELSDGYNNNIEDYDGGDNKIYMPSFPCEVELDFANQNRIKYNIIGGFLPACNPKGGYMPLQSNVSSGERWCVDAQTGHEIVPTRVVRYQPDPDCYNINNTTQVQEETQVQGGNTTANVSLPFEKMPIGIPWMVYFPYPNGSQQLPPNQPNTSQPTSQPSNEAVTQQFLPNQPNTSQPLNEAATQEFLPNQPNTSQPLNEIVTAMVNYPNQPNTSQPSNEATPQQFLPNQQPNTSQPLNEIVTALVNYPYTNNGTDTWTGTPSDYRDSNQTLDSYMKEYETYDTPKIQRHDITKNESSALQTNGSTTAQQNFIPEAELPQQQENKTSTVRDSDISPHVSSIMSIQNYIQNTTQTDYETSLYRNRITPVANDSVQVQNDNQTSLYRNTITPLQSIQSIIQNITPTDNETSLYRNRITPVANDSVPAQNDNQTSLNRNTITPQQIIQNVIQNITPTDNETSLFRNKITPMVNDSVPVQNTIPLVPLLNTTIPSVSVRNTTISSPEISKTTSNTTKITSNFTEAKEDMKDLGEAIGSLFGGLFSAMIPIVNETTNASSIGAKPKHNMTQSPNVTVDKYAKERAELTEYAHNCPYEIGINLTKMGCMNDDQQVPRPLPVLLINETLVDTKDEDEWKLFIRGLMCKCAIETRKKGWYTFGLQSYGECFSGPDEGRYNEDGEASEDMCIDEKQEKCTGKNNQACAGISETDKESGKKKSANYVFMIITDTHKEINIIHYDRRKRKRTINSRLKRSSHKKRRKHRRS